MKYLKRRNFIKKGILTSLGPFVIHQGYAMSENPISLQDEGKNNVKLSLNAYSFNGPLSKNEMSLAELMAFCSELGFPGIDITAYYFPGYPVVPKDEFLYRIKNQATRLGLHISGTGVRNDFTHSDRSKRKEDIQMVKNWIIAAAKLGAPVIRVFSGTQPVAPSKWKEVAAWMVADLKECVEFGAAHGVIVALQNHNDFIETAEQVDYFMQEVSSPWFGLILDIGSYAKKEPYQEIKDNIGHAVSWQIKEKVNHFGKEKAVDLPRLMKLIKDSNYHGYLPIETLGPGDPFEKVKDFADKVRVAMRERGLGD
jgi:sugar phosphate isomerase/epimerase